MSERLRTLLEELADLAGMLARRDYGRATWRNFVNQLRSLLI